MFIIKEDAIVVACDSCNFTADFPIDKNDIDWPEIMVSELVEDGWVLFSAEGETDPHKHCCPICLDA